MDRHLSAKMRSRNHALEETTFVEEDLDHIKMALLDCLEERRGTSVVWDDARGEQDINWSSTRASPLISISTGDAWLSMLRTASMFPSEHADQSGETIASIG